MTSIDDARFVLLDSDCLFDEQQVMRAYDQLAERIESEYAELNPIMLVVMNGGMVPAVELIRRLGFPFELDYLHATRYRGATTGGGLEWKNRPQKVLAGRHVLVIDDILDEGNTLVAVRAALLDQAPASLKVAVLAEKQHDRRAPGAHAEFVGLSVPDRYVFGCGMDYKEYWRQLPRIHALKETG
jgi:hypoxanthine phosphoribosyltransferase